MFFGCHNHTDEGSNLRLRDSINKVPDLIEYSHELGHKGIVITEHESITSHLNALKYYNSIKHKSGWEGFKVALGNEIYLCPENVTADNIGNNYYPHFILIALDAEGHKGIRELSSKAWVDNAFMHVMYRVPTYYSDLAEMLQKYKGHIIGSTACLGGAIPKRLLEYKDHATEDIWNSIITWIDTMNEWFGEGYFFLEMQPSEQLEQIYVNLKLVELSEVTNTPYIITTDAHYLKKEDRDIHRTYLNSQDGDREVDEFYATTYVMSEEEIHLYMDEYLGEEAVQKGINNTMLIYNMVEDYELTKPLHIPYIPLNKEEPDERLFQKYKDKVELLDFFFHSEYDSDRHMIRDILKRMDKDPFYRMEQAFEKINECLDYIKQSSEKNKVRWSAYLMQVADYVDIAWKTGTLVDPGRGSGVGFCLLDMLNITQINPMREKTQTFPWRFMNPERVSVLDIDVDIMSCMRDKVIQALKDTYGEDRVCKVMTLSTEKPKMAILTAARGLGMDNNTASYIASLVISDRGIARSLSTMYYGNEDYAPSPEFKRSMDAHPDLWEAAQKIEGLVSNVGSHAGGVIIVDEPFTESTALMRTKAGDVITQFDLHGCEDVSLIKIDLLCIDALDKIYETLMLLLKDNVIKWQGSLRDTYEKYIGVYTLERDNEDMWKLLWNHKVLSLFQMEKESGKQALALAKPHSVDDLATINSVIRLMSQEKGAETPLNKFARFKNDINEWYQEMDDAGLTKEEQKILEPILKSSYGICETQEKFMRLVQLPECGGFSLSWADRLRKSIAKKNPKEYDQLTKEFFQVTKENGCSKNLCDYVWNTLIATSRGYGFNSSHTLAYSIVGLQELNLSYKYNPIYWQTANLVVDSGSLDEESNDSTDYGKMGVAIASVQKESVNVTMPLINEADFGFKPDIPNNRIIFGLKGINSINTELTQTIIANRPYQSIEDFAKRMIDTKIVSPSRMIQLIKGGCFTELHSKDRTETMDWYLRKYLFHPCKKLTMAQLNKMKELGIIPEKYYVLLDLLNLKEYILDDEGFYKNYIDSKRKKIPKKGYHDRFYILDSTSQPYFQKFFPNEEEAGVVDAKNGFYIISEKQFKKAVDKELLPFKEWMETALDKYNDALYAQIWNQYASGTLPHWSMESLCYYDSEHELEHINEEKYGVVNYFELPEEPEPYDYYTRWIDGERKQIPKHKISRIAGTVLKADNFHSMVTLLTKYGPVNVKFNKGHYSFYNKIISVVDPETGKKKKIEDSWLKRGSLIMVAGIRRGDQFIPMVYKDTIYKHTVNLIKEVNGRDLVIQQERTQG